jgi:hypothetical protein
MLKPLFACLALAALPSAALSQRSATPGEWTVSGSASGCIAHTTLSQDIVVSVLAGTGQESLLFLIQNRGWDSLEDGSRHELAVQLDGGSQFEFDAVAKTELDSDGPGLMFAVPPGEADGARFIAEFAKAGGMAVGEDGEAIASVRLTGGGSAMTELAQCMSRLWSGGATAQKAKSRAATGAGPAIKL